MRTNQNRTLMLVYINMLMGRLTRRQMPLGLQLVAAAARDVRLYDAVSGRQLKQIRAQAMELLNSPELTKDFVFSRFMELNAQFHETIYQATGSRFIMVIINQLRGIVQVMRSMSLQVDQSSARAWVEHSRLIHHLEKRDVQAAQELIQQHVQTAAQEVLSIMRERA